MKKINIIFKYLALLFVAILIVQCSDDENTKFDPPTVTESTHANDVYNKAHMLDKYNTAVRWRWRNSFISPAQNAVPIKSELVVPTTKLCEYLWIGAYESVGEPGVKFIKELYPPELVYIGSYIFNTDGTMLLGYAEGGARITLLNLNSYDLTNRDWMTNPGGGILATVHHEFSHIVHQNYGIPAGFNKVSDKYLGNGWSNNVSLDDAIKLGMVRNYGTLNEYEDFCEIISHYLTLPKATWEETFINQQDYSKETDPAKILNIQKLNAGRKKIATKLNLIIDHYKSTFNINLTQVRDTLEKRIDYVVTNNKIPLK